MVYNPPETPIEYAPQYYVRIFKRVIQTDVANTNSTDVATRQITDPTTGVLNLQRLPVQATVQNKKTSNVPEVSEIKNDLLGAHEYNPVNVLSIKTNKDLNTPSGRWSIEFDYRYGRMDDPNNIFQQIEPMDYVEIYLQRTPPQIKEGQYITRPNGSVASFGRYKRKTSTFIGYDPSKQSDNWDVVSEAETKLFGGMDDTGRYYPDLEWVGEFIQDLPLTIEEKVDNPHLVMCGFVDSVDNNYSMGDGPNNRIVLSGRCVGKILEEHNIFFNPQDNMGMVRQGIAQMGIPALTAVQAVDFLLHNYLQNALDPTAEVVYDTTKSKEYRNKTEWLSGSRAKIVMDGEASTGSVVNITHLAPPMSRFIYWAQDTEANWGRMEEHSSELVRAVGNISDGPLWSKLQQICDSNLNEFWIDECGNVVLRLAKHAWESPTQQTIRKDIVYQISEKERIRTDQVGPLYDTKIMINPDKGGLSGTGAGSKLTTYPGTNDSCFNFRVAVALQQELKIRGAVASITRSASTNPLSNARFEKAKGNFFFLTITSDFSSKVAGGGLFVGAITGGAGASKSVNLANKIKVELNKLSQRPIDAGIPQMSKEDIIAYRTGERISLEHEVNTICGGGAVIVRPANITAGSDASYFITGGEINQTYINNIAVAIADGIAKYAVDYNGRPLTQNKNSKVKDYTPEPRVVKRRWGGDHIFLDTKDIHSWNFSKSDRELKTIVQSIPSAHIFGETARSSGFFGQVPVTKQIYELIIKQVESNITTIQNRIKDTKNLSGAQRKEYQTELWQAKRELQQTIDRLSSIRTEGLCSHIGSYPLTPKKKVVLTDDQNKWLKQIEQEVGKEARLKVEQNLIATNPDDNTLKFWQRFGMRPMSVADIYNVNTTDLIDSASTIFRHYANFWWVGSLVVKGDSRYRIGRKIEIPELKMTFYCTGVDHNFNWGENWTTTLHICSGELVNSPTDSRIHPQDAYRPQDFLNITGV